MNSAFPSGSYALQTGNGGGMFVRIEGNTLKFFDDPKDPLLGTLRIQEANLTPSLDDQTVHEIDGDVLVFEQPSGGGPRRLKLKLDPKP
jgi:hypothetical protein